MNTKTLDVKSSRSSDNDHLRNRDPDANGAYCVLAALMDHPTMESAADDPRTEPELLNAIAGVSRDDHILWKVALNPRVSHSTLAAMKCLQLSDGARAAIEVALADDLAALASRAIANTNEDRLLRNALATCWRTPAHLLARLAHDDMHLHATAVIMNPSTPLDVLRDLADDEDIGRFTQQSARRRLAERVTE